LSPLRHVERKVRGGRGALPEVPEGTRWVKKGGLRGGQRGERG